MWKRVLLVVMVAFLVGCGRSQDAGPPAQQFVNYESQEFGVALEHPQDWVTYTGFNGLTVASDRSVIDGSSLGEIGDEAFVNVIVGELDVLGMETGERFEAGEPDAVLRTYKRLLEDGGQVFKVVEPATTTREVEENAAWMVVSSPVEGETLVTILGAVIQGEYVALVSAGALEGQFENVQPTLRHVVESIVVSSPSTGGR